MLESPNVVDGQLDAELLNSIVLSMWMVILVSAFVPSIWPMIRLAVGRSTSMDVHMATGIWEVNSLAASRCRMCGAVCSRLLLFG